MNTLKALTFLCVFMQALGFARAESSAEFRFRIREDKGSLDWNYGEVNQDVVLQLMEGLTTSGARGEPLPALAKSWRAQASRGSYELVFQIREDAKWSDGAPVCAQHFVDSWVRTLSPEFASPYAHYLFSVRNAEKFNLGKIKDPAALGIKAEGCHALRVSFERPASYFVGLTSHWVLFPIRKELIDKLGSKWTEPGHLVVAGPFQLEAWKRDVEFVLKKNPGYYDAANVQIERLRAIVVPDDASALSLFEVKPRRLDWLRDLPYLEKQKLSGRAEYRLSPTLIEYHLGFRVGAGKGNVSRADRCAILQAISESAAEIPEILKGGEQRAGGVVPQEMFSLGALRAHKSFTKTVSRALLKQPPVIHYYAKEIHVPLMDWVQSVLKKKLGLRVKIEKESEKSYWARLQKTPPEIFLSGITAAYAHPNSFLSEFAKASPANYGKFFSMDFERALTRLALAEPSDEMELMKWTHNAEKSLIEDECAVIPLYFRKNAVLANTEWNIPEMNILSRIYFKEISLATPKPQQAQSPSATPNQK